MGILPLEEILQCGLEVCIALNQYDANILGS